MKSRKITTKNFLLGVSLISVGFYSIGQEGQNLIENGNFESASNKVRRTGQIDKAENWVSATGESADIFLAGAKMPDVMTPENVYGKEDPKDGENYAGIIVYSYNDKENRTYITTKLSSPMKKGMRYKVQFSASLAELSKYSSNRLGAHFSKRELSTKEKVPALIEKTHIEHPKQEVFTGMYGWDLVCGEYIAEGGEKYMTIGNFTANNDVKSERNKKPKEIKGRQIIAAYYYIDDVSVQLLGPNERCNCPYGEQFEQESATIYQREPNINDKMTTAEKVNEINVFYRAGRYDLTISGDEALNKIAGIMKENTALKIKIKGHADNFEYDDPETRDISLKRAEYIRSQMVNKGVDASRFTIADIQNKEASPYIKDVDDDKTESAKNRRVSFEVIE